MSLAAIVIDNGSSACRAGFCGEEKPRTRISTTVGRLRQMQIMAEAKLKDAYVGNEAQELRGLLALSHPIERGVITDYDDMERIFDHVFHNELKVNVAEHDILMTEPPLNPNAQKEKLTQMMFETYTASGLYISMSGVHSLYASGRVTGTVLMSGDGVTHTVPVIEGCANPHAILRSPICGRDLTEHFVRKLTLRGYSFVTVAEREIVREAKESLCYVALDYEREMEASPESSHQLPDGQAIDVGRERFEAAEALFQPDLMGYECGGLHELVFATIMRSDVDARRRLYGNVLLAGGNTAFAGLPERLRREMGHLVPPAMVDLRVAAPEDRHLTEWIGGSVLAALSAFPRLLLSKDEYDECGPAIIHRKCPGVV